MRCCLFDCSQVRLMQGVEKDNEGICPRASGCFPRVLAGRRGSRTLCRKDI
jgi:hypothetical protein